MRYVHYLEGRVIENGCIETKQGNVDRFTIIEVPAGEDPRWPVLTQKLVICGLHSIGASVTFTVEVKEDQKERAHGEPPCKTAAGL